MPEISFLIIILLFNSLEIFGFYYACKFEWGDDLVEFEAEIESGELLLLADGIKRGAVSIVEVEHNVTTKPKTWRFNIPKDSLLAFEPASPQTQITISNISRHTIIEEKSKEILWFIKYYSEKWIGDKWTKPICGCVICMASLHSLLVWIPIYCMMEFHPVHLYFHAVYICALAGFNYLITSVRWLDL